MKRVTSSLVAAALVLAGLAQAVRADEAPPLSALAKMPVREVTVFKDGHALVLHSGKMPVDESGGVLMDYLPMPVLGTYWPYSADKNAKLKAVVASQRRVLVERTALDLRALIEANIGMEAIITESPSGRETAPTSYPATIVGVPTRSSDELQSTSPPGSGEMLPQKGNVVLLKTADGIKALDFGRILDVTFKGQPKALAANEEFRNLLSLKLEWKGKPAKEADVGMFYVQRGLRWIPSYKVVIDGKGSANVKLEATLINELTDLENVTAHLVIGVPTFSMQDKLDPISMQQAAAQLSQYFRRDGDYLSNSLMSQVRLGGALNEREGGRPAGPAAPPALDLGPEVAGAGQNEDLFVFTVSNVTLKKGQRMVLPVTEVTVKYRDVYTLDVPFAPPAEVWRNFNTDQQAQMARALGRPMPMHQLRITNGKEYPLTTAPALIIASDRILGQGMMTFTSKGGDVDLPITAAVDIKVKKAEKETQRTPNAIRWNSDEYSKVDLAGTLALTNYSDKTVEIEVKRYVLGNLIEAGQDGKIESINIFEDPSFLASDGAQPRPFWWGWYSWPYWWYHFNAVGKVSWTVKLDSGQTVELDYSWNYFWR